jgi:hypothetical protein
MEIPLKKFLMYVLFLFAVVGAMIENVQGQFDCCTFERPCQPISSLQEFLLLPTNSYPEPYGRG